MKLNRHLIIAGLLGAAYFAPAANAVPINVNSYIGSYTPANAYNNNADVTQAANAIVNWYNGGTNANTVLPSATFTLANPGLAPLPATLTFGAKDDTAPFGSFNNTVYTYVMAKAGTSAYLYYLGNLVGGTYEAPATLPNGSALSHWVTLTVVNPPFLPPPGVPDGGSTAAMLGLGLIAMAFALRRRS